MGKKIIYQLIPRLWGNDCENPVKNGNYEVNGSGKFSDIDEYTLRYLKNLGISHLWLTGVIRNAARTSFEGCPRSNSQIVKGNAGSPYSIVDYYDVNPCLADNPSDRMQEFEALTARVHKSGLKALIDFVPNHVSRDYGKAGLAQDGVPPFGLGDDCSRHWKPENDFYYYPGQALALQSSVEEGENPYYENPAKASGNCFSPSPSLGDWYDTVRLNYCDFPTPTWEKMYDIVRFWCLKGVDGFRCDMVEMVPWEFFRWLIDRIKQEFPEVIFIAEVYRKENYPLYVKEAGFDLLYDKSGLYDSVRSIVEGTGSARSLTWNWQSVGDLQPQMLNFLENHDEQRFASDFFGKDASHSYAALCASLFFNTSSFMVYFGEEVGERGMDEEGFSGRDGRTSIFDWWSIGSVRRLRKYIHSGSGLQTEEKSVLDRYARALNMAASVPAISEGATYDLCYCNCSSPGFNPDRHFAFLRGKGSKIFLFLCNFSSEQADIHMIIPHEALDYFGVELPDLDKGLEYFISAKGYDCSVLSLF